jgi:catechol 2,3-dioxygenase-like lactoylglutathione lyase family enzyme
MDLGVFSISLAVKDLESSRTFYEKLGFAVFAGDASQSRSVGRRRDGGCAYSGLPVLLPG